MRLVGLDGHELPLSVRDGFDLGGYGLGEAEGHVRSGHAGEAEPPIEADLEDALAA
jgi:hypothetical protein